jgi:hypothetical protein
MEEETFRSRLTGLLQKSRKALRLYSSVGRQPSPGRSELTELQADAWKNVNAELLKSLGSALENPNQKQAISAVFTLRDRFLAEYRSIEAELHAAQKELVVAAEHGDFVKATVLSRDLVSLKARVQATQAAQHELEAVIKQSRITCAPIELSGEQVVRESARPAAKGSSLPPLEEGIPLLKAEPGGTVALARVIPLRKRG